MTYNEFRLRFAIAYVGGVSDPGEAIRRMDNAPTLARMLWDVMNAPEVPAPSFVSTAGLAPFMENSPKNMANSPDLKPSNSMDLKALARTARQVVDDGLQWIGIDLNGQVWAYDLKPSIYEPGLCWDNSADGGYSWEIGAVAPPEDFRQELYEISKLLEKTITKEQFKQIAQKASSESDGKAHWIAIDSDGEVWAYNIRPFTSGAINYWVDSDPHNRRRWKIGMVAPPEDFRNELYEIDKLLTDA